MCVVLAIPAGYCSQSSVDPATAQENPHGVNIVNELHHVWKRRR
jgi:hypothetical protein